MLAIEQQDKLLEELQTKKKTIQSVYKYILKSEFVEKVYYNTLDLCEDLMISWVPISNYFKHPEKKEKNIITQLGFTLERIPLIKNDKNCKKVVDNMVADMII